MRIPSMLLALALVAFSGCSEPGSPDIVGDEPNSGGNETADPNSPDHEEGKTPGGAGDNSGNATNEAPAANLTADLLTGEAPLRVTFHINATDADGDELAWTLFAGERGVANGSQVPANASYEFKEAGSYNVTLSVTDGTASASAALRVEVLEAIAAEPVYDGTHAWAGGVTETVSMTDYFMCDALPGSGTTHVSFVLPADAGGRTFTATLDAATGISSVVEWGFYVQESSSCDGSVEEFFGEFTAPVGDGVTGTITGTVPASADFVTAYATGGANLSLHFVVE